MSTGVSILSLHLMLSWWYLPKSTTSFTSFVRIGKFPSDIKYYFVLVSATFDGSVGRLLCPLLQYLGFFSLSLADALNCLPLC